MSNNKKFELSREQKFMRGLIFLAGGTFLLLRFAAAGNNMFFIIATWFVGLLSLLALGLYLWSIYK